MLDRDADEDERTDALREFSNEYGPAPEQPAWLFEEHVLDAFVELAGRDDEAEFLLMSEAAETLALVWIHRDRFEPADHARFERLTDIAQAEVRGYFDVNGRSHWLA